MKRPNASVLMDLSHPWRARIRYALMGAKNYILADHLSQMLEMLKLQHKAECVAEDHDWEFCKLPDDHAMWNF